MDLITLEPKLTIGTGDLELYLKMSMNATGEVVVDKKADSLVPNFLRIMMSFMGNELHQPGLFFNSSDSEAFPDVMRDYAETAETVLSVTPGNPTRVTFVANMNTFDNAGDQGIQLAGIGGIVPNINGFHPPADITYISDSVVDIAIDTTGSPAYSDDGSLVRLWEDWGTNSPQRPNASTFGDFIIVVGENADANITDQQSLNKEWPATTTGESFKIQYTEPTVAAPAFDVGAGTGEMFFSAIISNTSGANLALGEIALYARIYDSTNDNRYVLIARDTVSTTLTNGSSATVNYSLQTNQSGVGGLTTAFMNMLYRQFHPTSGNVTIVNIDGGNHVDSDDTGAFQACSTSGDIKGTFVGLTGRPGDDIGPQVGTGNTAMAIDDNALETRIDHGETSGTLFHHGAIVRNFQIVGSVASFEIVKLFENLSGGLITVNEVGMYVGSEELNGAIVTDGVHMIHREVLAAPIGVTDTSILKLVYTMELTVA